jgi:hypothetical protein
MAANGITLKPIRMGDLVAQDSSKKSGAYVPPNRRGGGSEPVVIPQKIDMSDTSFPALGVVPKKLPSWGKHIVAKAEPTKAEPKAQPTEVEPKAEPTEVKPKQETLSDKIQESIRLNAISELRASTAETDPFKMTDTQLAETGWVRLRLSRAKEICMSGFSKSSDPYLPGFIQEADSGMSYEEYVHYKNSKVVSSIPYRQPAPSLVSDDDYYSDDYDE